MIRILAAASLLALAALPVAAQQPSPCRGLDTNACSSNASCTWQAARVVGEKSPKTGKPYTRPMKAHCRLGARTKA